LRRVGCHLGSIDGKWNAASQRALEGFNKFAGLKLDVKEATEDALDAVRSKKSRVCPLVCERGYRAAGERCVAITCPNGQFLNSSGACEAKPSKAAAKPQPAKPRSNDERPRPTSGQQQGVVCDLQGCRSAKIGRTNPDGSVPAGCQRINTAGSSASATSGHATTVVCN
jgi:hypothetical protein